MAQPKSQIGSIRGGIPVRLRGRHRAGEPLFGGRADAQAARVAEVQHSLEAMVREDGLGRIDIEPVVVRHGFEADAREVALLVAAVDDATKLSLGHPVALANPVYSSMWRDQNVFNMHRIPAITTGFAAGGPPRRTWSTAPWSMP